MPIIIVGQPRTGSSSVAKIVKEAGVFIGDEYLGLKDQVTYEDKELCELSMLMTEGNTTKEEYKEMFLHITKDRKEPWGWKDPRAYKLLDIYFEMFDDLKFIRCRRPVHKTMESMERVFGWSKEKAYTTYNATNYILDEKLEGKNVLDINIEDLKDGEAKDKILNFIKDE